MQVKDFDYCLPEDRIAQYPLEKRDSSKLMVLDVTAQKLHDKVFTDILDYLHAGDLLVFNDTRVIPARLIGKRPTGANIEVFLLKQLANDEWEVLVKPGRKALPDTEIEFGADFKCRVLSKTDFGGRIVKFEYQGVFNELLEKYGAMPLPPYIKAKLEDRERYQTVYSRCSGSVAAPTAGLHFTPELLARLEAKGVQTAFVTLHVGIGTFRPVSVDTIEEHKMHSEEYQVTPEVAELVNKAKEEGRRVIAVGTTAIRTLESATVDGKLLAGSGSTDIFIYPGYKFKTVNAIITNFHLPQSTLIMLVAAYAGREFTLQAYEHAVQNGYRFFSFGDAMFVATDLDYNGSNS